MKVNISVISNTSSELEKPASEPVILSNKRTGSESKKPASAAILIIPKSAKNELNISRIDTRELMILLAIAVLVFTSLVAVALTSYDYLPKICRIFEEKFGNDTSKESEFMSRICKYEEATQNVIAYAMIFIHLILSFINCVCYLLAKSKVSFGIPAIALTMNLFIFCSYATRLFFSTFGIPRPSLQFFFAFLMIGLSFLSIMISQFHLMQKNTKVLTMKPRNNIGEII